MKEIKSARETQPTTAPTEPVYVKPKTQGITVECNVDTTEMDEALVKARELVGLLEKIDGLTGRIARDIDKINRYTLGK